MKTIDAQDLTIPKTFFEGAEPQWYSKSSDLKTQKKTKVEPTKRWGHTSVVVDDKLIIYGGAANNANFQLNEILYQLDMTTWNWTKLAPSNVSPGVRDSHSCVAYKGKLFVFGGSVGSESKQDLWEFNIATNTWRELESRGDVPPPREGHSSCLFMDKYMLIYGGWDGSQNFNDCYLFDLSQNIWIKVNSKSTIEPITREGHSFGILRNCLYFFGGQGSTNTADNKSFDNYFNEFYKLEVTFEGNMPFFTWNNVDVQGTKPTRRSAHSSCSYKDRYLFIIGGEGYSPELNEETLTEEDLQALSEKKNANEEYPCYPKNDVWYYDIETNQWNRLRIKNEKEFEPRFAQTCSVYRQNLILFGGLKDYDNCTNDVNILSLDGSNPFLPKQQNKIEQPKTVENQSMEIEDTKESKLIPRQLPLKNDSFVVKRQDGLYETKRDRSQASKLPKTWPLVSASFSHCLANMITWPLAAFGLLLDNALIVRSSSLKISLLENPPKKTVQNENESTEANGNEKEKDKIVEETATETKANSSRSIVVQDDGKGWKFHEFVNILMNYDTDGFDLLDQDLDENFNEVPTNRINEYAFNLKAASFRLGSAVIYISQASDEVCLGYLTSSKDSQTNNEPIFCVWKKNSNEFLTEESEKNKATILSKVEGMITEEELLSGLDQYSNKLVILNLTQVVMPKPNSQKDKEYELYLNPKSTIGNDIMVKHINSDLASSLTSNQVIELSLRTYFRYFFLDASLANIKVYLNEDPVSFSNLKDFVGKKIEQNNFVKIEEKGLFEGSIVFYNSQEKEANRTSEQNESEVKNKQILNEEEHNQGVLLYFRNRLIRRLENSKLGDFTFLSQNYNKLQNNETKSHAVSKYYGYIQLSNFFKPNLFKMEIENPYFSNYVYSFVMYKMTLFNKAGKRERVRESELDEHDQVVKKVKAD